MAINKKVTMPVFGYQPKSTDEANLSETLSQEQFTALLHQVLDDQMVNCQVNLVALADIYGVSRFQLNRISWRYYGMSMSQYVQRYRVRRACHLLRQNRLSVSQIGRLCGFADNSYFSRFFMKEMGCTPSEFAGKRCKKS